MVKIARRIKLLKLAGGLLLPVYAFVAMTTASCQNSNIQNSNIKDLNTLISEISDVQLENSGPKLIAKEGKGALLEVDGQKIIVLKGTPYEMGYQYGVLLKNEVKEFTEKIIEALFSLAPGGLEKAWEAAEKFIPERYKEELKGLAEGAGVKLEDVQLVNVFPELFHCSGIVLYGKATKDGELLHARILDYTTSHGLQDYAIVSIVQPDGYNAFINVGVAGLIGSVTGMNEKHVAVGEMGGGGEGQWEGIPMTFLFRMALEEGNTLEEAVNVFKDNPRTCEYYYVISDAKINDARGLYCTPETFISIKPGEDNELFPVPPPEDALVISEADRYGEAVKRINENYGNIDKDVFIEILKRPVSMNSNLHNVIFMPKYLKLWYALADDPSKMNYQACYQTYYEYDMPLILKYYNSLE